MKLQTFVNYKVIEAEKAILVLYNGDFYRAPGAIELVIAPLEVCFEFLQRYVEHRSKGKDPLEARRLALRGARIINQPDKPVVQ